MRSCHHLLWLPLILGSAVSAIYINVSEQKNKYIAFLSHIRITLFSVMQ